MSVTGGAKRSPRETARFELNVTLQEVSTVSKQNTIKVISIISFGRGSSRVQMICFEMDLFSLCQSYTNHKGF